MICTRPFPPSLAHIASRYRTLPHAPRHCSHHFHNNAPLRAEEQDHYAVLGVAPSASPAEIKKSFYALSKRHHPDRNPDNHEEAEKKFIEVGDAYAVLSNSEKRSRYDRERTPASARGVSNSSYGSSSPGGRPASGLSRRRSAFRGPPPSFYRSGGWGSAQTQNKRSQAADADGRMEWERLRREEEVRAQGGKVGEDDGSGWPFGTDPNDVPHFNRAQHFRRTSTVEEQLRQGRKKRRKVFVENVMSDGGGSEVRAFFLITGVVAVGIGTPLVFLAR